MKIGRKKQQKAENRTEKELTTPVLGMSVIWVVAGTNRYDAYPKHQSRNHRSRVRREKENKNNH